MTTLHCPKRADTSRAHYFADVHRGRQGSFAAVLDALATEHGVARCICGEALVPVAHPTKGL